MARRVNRRPTWRAATRWIAFNDNAGRGDSEREISRYLTSRMIADLFEADVALVAADVVRERRKAQLPVDPGED